MDLAKARALNYHIIQPFVLDRFINALDSGTSELLNEIWKKENLTLIAFRDLLATRQDNLVQREIQMLVRKVTQHQMNTKNWVHSLYKRAEVRICIEVLGQNEKKE